MKSVNILILALVAGLLAACGGSGGGSNSGPETTAVTLSAQVYDEEIANAEVSVYVGDTEVATTTTDAEGNYSVDLEVSEEARAQRCVVVARRDSIRLRSLLGNVGSITDTATGNDGSVSPNELPSANVTNVSTAVAAVIESTGAALPDSQEDIDAALKAIADDPSLRNKVIKISAAIKAVVDYNGSVGSDADTDALAKRLAESSDIDTDVQAVVDTSEATTDQLINEVEGDPTLASQIPTDEATLVAGLAGNTYVTDDNNEGTLIAFGASSMTIADYSDIESGGITGTWTDNQDGTFAINFTDPDYGDTTVDFTVTGGSENALSTTAVLTEDAGTEDLGSLTFRRIIPVSVDTSGANNINIDTDLTGTFVFDVAESNAAYFAGACDGTFDNVSLFTAQGEAGGTCGTALGMLVIDDGIEKSMVGLLPSSWNGTTLSQKMNVVSWEADPDLGGVASYGRVYQPIDNGVPASDIVLRLYPDSGDGTVGAQLRFITQADTAGDTAADGTMDLYNYFQGTYSARTKEHIVETTHPNETGTLIVNGSINEGVLTTDLWQDSTDPSVSIGIALGSNANSRLNAVLTPNSGHQLRTRYVYPLEPIVAADVSGKTFDFADLVYDESGTITFNTDGSVEVTEDGAAGSETASWAIAPALQTAEMTPVGDGTYGETLVITWGGGDIDYLFANKSGSTLVVGGYFASGTGAENLAVILTEQQ